MHALVSSFLVPLGVTFDPSIADTWSAGGECNRILNPDEQALLAKLEQSSRDGSDATAKQVSR